MSTIPSQNEQQNDTFIQLLAEKNKVRELDKVIEDLESRLDEVKLTIDNQKRLISELQSKYSTLLETAKKIEQERDTIMQVHKAVFKDAFTST